MVNFQDGQSVTIGNENMNKMIIIQRRYDLIEALENYLQAVDRLGGESNVISEKGTLKARLYSYYIEVRSKLKGIDKIKMLYNRDYTFLELDKIFQDIEEWVSSNGITSIGGRVQANIKGNTTQEEFEE